MLQYRNVLKYVGIVHVSDFLQLASGDRERLGDERGNIAA